MQRLNKINDDNLDKKTKKDVSVIVNASKSNFMKARNEFITREEFVKICTRAIHTTRDDLTIINQLSGYIEFHNEAKNNSYLECLRKIIDLNTDYNGLNLQESHDIIKQAGVGACDELAIYLSVEIMNQLIDFKNQSAVKVVGSPHGTHTFVRIEIWLKNERAYSQWYVDAWNPGIIDITKRPDKSIKNQEVLIYGSEYEVDYNLKPAEFGKNKRKRANENTLFLQNVKKPRPGTPARDATPPRDMLSKNHFLYSDYTLPKAYEEKKLDKHGEIHYLQRKSKWQ